MNGAILFIDKAPGRVVERAARAAKAQGFDSVYICPKGTQFTDRGVFVEVIENEDWTRGGLRALVDSAARRRTLRGLSFFYGFFHEDGLLGADVATLAAERGLPSQDPAALYRTNNKFLMRDALRAAGVPTVDFGMATDERSAKEHAARIGYPVILKPVCGLASSLILKCRDEDELLANFRLALERLPLAFYSGFFSRHSFPDSRGRVLEFDPAASMLVEKYIPGMEASVECVVTQTQIIALLVHDKVDVVEGKKIVYENVLVVPPVRFGPSEAAEMKAYAKRCLRAVGLRNTLSHVELRYSKELGPQLLEINPRVGGMRVTDSLKTMLGFDAMAAQTALAAGTFARGRYRSRTQLHAMFALYPDKGGVLTSVVGIEKARGLDGVIDLACHYPVGAKIGGDDEECFLVSGWMKARSLGQVMQTYAAARDAVRCEVQAPS